MNPFHHLTREQLRVLSEALDDFVSGCVSYTADSDCAIASDMLDEIDTLLADTTTSPETEA